MRTRQSLSDLIEGRLSSPDGRAELVRLATRLIVEEALEAESSDAVGRGYYEHGAAPGQGYRNGSRTGRLKTAEGLIEYAAPQVAGRDEPFRSEIRDHKPQRTIPGNADGNDTATVRANPFETNPKNTADGADAKSSSQSAAEEPATPGWRGRI
jgi:hypothetical protein